LPPASLAVSNAGVHLHPTASARPRLCGVVVALGATLAFGQARAGTVTQVGEILVVQGDDEILEVDGNRASLRAPLAGVSRRVIEKLGDHFQAITLWTTFDDRSNSAVAYEQTVKIDVQGLGVSKFDRSRMYGSQGTLRSIVNMKRVGLQAGDTRDKWEGALATWGQEVGHRWMMFMRFIDRRSGRASDALLGRSCSHYSRFVDSQASVHDGFAWRDNGDGTFTATGANQRFGNLDLYGMGVLPADEVPPFFFIDEIPGYKAPRCGAEYDATRKPLDQTISGKRVDVSIEDVVAAVGPRVPSSEELVNGERQDYFREAEVVVTLPNETPDSPAVRLLVERLEKARLWWEEWMRSATGNRMVVCTRLGADCGDARSDVTAVRFNPDRRGPGPTLVEVQIENAGARAATDVKASLEVDGSDAVRLAPTPKDVGVFAPGTQAITFEVDLRGLACGAELFLKARTQSAFHGSRRRVSVLVGTETPFVEDFEAARGWTVNPEGDDTTKGGAWERGKPERDELGGEDVQPDGAHRGIGAFVTGATAGGSNALVNGGRSTLESPAIDARALRAPRLRYWVSFAGVRAAAGGGIEPSPDSALILLGRQVAPADDAGPLDTGWVEIERLSDRTTKGGWIQRTVALPDELWGRGELRVRFVAADQSPRAGGVEAALDDLELTSNLPACDLLPAAPDGGATAPDAAAGCDCALGADRRRRVTWPGLVAALAFGLIPLRRNGRKP
jgi:hypothetical protein